MKNRIVLFLLIWVLCASSKTNAAVNTFAFLVEDIIECDTLNRLLTTQEQEVLTKGVIMPVVEHSQPDSVYLTAVRQIYDDVLFLSFKVVNQHSVDMYVATYKNSGTLSDAMMIGCGWNTLHFVDNQNFILKNEYRESERDSVTFYKTITLAYNIDPEGKIKMNLAGPEILEEGVFRVGGDYAKKELDLIDEIETALCYPYSDETALERWNQLGKKVDGAPSELLSLYFFNFVFQQRPVEVLKWVYNHRDIEFLPLESTLSFYYGYEPKSREIIDAAISKLDAPMRAYYKEKTKEWLY